MNSSELIKILQTFPDLPVVDLDGEEMQEAHIVQFKNETCITVHSVKYDEDELDEAIKEAPEKTPDIGGTDSGDWCHNNDKNINEAASL